MFFITGLPRSRTAWFSAFMTASGYPCLHEGANNCLTMDEYKNRVRFISDSNTAFGFIPIPYDRPLLIIHRKNRHGVEFDKASDRLKKLNGLHVDFEDINKRIEEIFNYLTGRRINKTIFNKFKNLKITTLEKMNDDAAIRLFNEANK